MKGFLVILTLLFTQIALAEPHGVFLTRQKRDALQLFSSMQTPTNVQTFAGTQLLYYGGPVVHSANVIVVNWTSAIAAQTQKNIGPFFNALVNSNYIDWLKIYDTNIKAVDGRVGTHQTITRGKFVGTYTITPNNKNTNLTDADIQTELQAQIAAGNLPKPNNNTIYMTYFPAGYSISIAGGQSCVDFCAYHDAFKSAKFGNIFYGVMPSLTGSCSFGCGSGFSALTFDSSHELLEAITDPFPTPGSNPAYPQAWNTSNGYEIADLCENNSPTTLNTKSGRSYAVTTLFDDRTNACSTGPYQSSK